MNTTLHTFQVGDRVALADDEHLVPHMYEIGQQGTVAAVTGGATILIKWDKGGESHLAPWRLESVLVVEPTFRYVIYPTNGCPDLCQECGVLVGNRILHDADKHRSLDALLNEPIPYTLVEQTPYTPDSAPVGTLAVLGHPANNIRAVKTNDGWRYVLTLYPVAPEQFRGGWEILA